jgi:ribose/xylose/arabinose/galactoside ABC-type transport system permease subunit
VTAGSSDLAQEVPGLEAPAGASPAARWAGRLRDALPVLGLLGLVAWFTSASPYFLDTVNATNLLTDAATLLVCAFGMTLVILVGEIDLSVAAMISVLCVVLARLLAAGLPWPLVLVLVLLAGAGIGLLNGALTVYGDIPSFIVTLGTASIATGLAYALTGSLAIPIADQVFLDLFYTRSWLGVPVPLMLVGLCFCGAGLFLRRSAVGRELYAVGANREAARFSGVRVERVRLLVFAVTGLLVGVGAVFAAARLGSGAPNAFPSLTLDVIAAVILGGAALTGGRASLSRTLLGVLLIAVLNNGLTLLSAESSLQYVVKGVIILLAVLLDRSAARTGS